MKIERKGFSETQLRQYRLVAQAGWSQPRLSLLGYFPRRFTYTTVRNSAAFVGHVCTVPAGVRARYKRAPTNRSSRFAHGHMDARYSNPESKQGLGVGEVGQGQIGARLCQRLQAVHARCHRDGTCADGSRATDV